MQFNKSLEDLNRKDDRNSPVRAPAKASIESNVELGEWAFNRKEWRVAISRAEAALLAEPKNLRANLLAEQAKFELGVQILLDKAQEETIKKLPDWEKVHGYLNKIPRDSVYHSDKIDLMSQVIEKLVEEREAKTRSAIEEKRWGIALELIAEIEGLDVDNPLVPILQAELRDAQFAPQERLGAAVFTENGASHVQLTSKKSKSSPSQGPGMVTPSKKNLGQLVQGHKERGEALYRQKKNKAALREFTLCLKRDPNNFSCQRYSGIIQMVNGDYKLAIESFQSYLSKGKGDLEVETERAIIQARIAKMEKLLKP